MQGVRPLLLLLCLLWFWSGTLGAESTNRLSRSRNRLSRPDKKLERQAQKLQKVVEELRGLEFLSAVHVGVKTPKQIRKFLIENLNEELPPEREKAIQKALVKWGLIPNNLPLREFVIDLLTEQIGGFYDPKKKELFVVRRSPKKRGPMEEMSKMMESTFGIDWDTLATVHELTHALQDQHFDLESYPADDPTNEDLGAALSAIWEGEATYVMYDHLFSRMGMDLAEVPDLTTYMGSMGVTGFEKMDKAPGYFKRGLMFPYFQGFSFIRHIKKKEGWEGVSRSYGDPPSSTELILHPEKYLGVRDYPTSIRLPDLRVELGKGWTLVTENVLGELNVDILLKEFFPTAKTKRSSEGWDGDRYAIYEKEGRPEVLLVSFSVWDTEKDAKEFFTAYQKLLVKKYALPDPPEDEAKALFRVEGAAGHGAFFLERRGAELLLLESAPEDTLNVVREKVWSGAEKSELKEVPRKKKGEGEAPAEPSRRSTEEPKKSEKPAKLKKSRPAKPARPEKPALPAGPAKEAKPAEPEESAKSAEAGEIGDPRVELTSPGGRTVQVVFRDARGKWNFQPGTTGYKAWSEGSQAVVRISLWDVDSESELWDEIHEVARRFRGKLRETGHKTGNDLVGWRKMWYEVVQGIDRSKKDLGEMAFAVVVAELGREYVCFVLATPSGDWEQMFDRLKELIASMDKPPR